MKQGSLRRAIQDCWVADGEERCGDARVSTRQAGFKRVRVVEPFNDSDPLEMCVKTDVLRGSAVLRASAWKHVAGGLSRNGIPRGAAEDTTRGGAENCSLGELSGYFTARASWEAIGSERLAPRESNTVAFTMSLPTRTYRDDCERYVEPYGSSTRVVRPCVSVSRA
jgi:hypothetical protein